MHSGALAAEHPSQMSELRPPSLWQPTLGRGRWVDLHLPGSVPPQAHINTCQREICMRIAHAGKTGANLLGAHKVKVQIVLGT